MKYNPEDKDIFPGEQPEEGSETETSNLSRRKMLKCMATWAGTGIVWTIGAGGLLTACGDLTATNAPATPPPSVQLAATANPTAPATTAAMQTGATPGQNMGGFTFVQVSDTHIGFNTAGVNTDVNGTLQQTISRINALPQRPHFVLHTGDVSHMSKPAEFDTAYQLMNTIKTSNFFYVPGEHDVLNDQGANFRQRFLTGGSRATQSWYSMDIEGVHFIGLSNAGELDAFGLLGPEQLGWLQKDLSSVKKDTPLVVFAHVPLFTVYTPWSWETKDSAQVLALLKPYSAVTVLNGHIHQVVTQVEGTVNFYTANSTAFPQHRPGVEKPNAYQLPASELLQNLGYRTINLMPGNVPAGVSDFTLAGTPASTLAITPGTTTEVTAPVAVATVSSAPGFVDVGAVGDFANASTTPQKITLPAPAGKAGTQTAFVLKQGAEYFGISDVCTHMGCEVSWVGQDSKFECPCHGSQYDITGKNIAGPAPSPLPRFKTQLVNGRLLVSYQPVKAGGA